jgi:hypothetical protein
MMQSGQDWDPAIASAVGALACRSCLIDREAVKREAEEDWGADSPEDAMNTLRSSFVGTVLLILPADAQEHRFEADPNVIVRENFVACDVLSQLQRVMDDPRSLLAGECEPLRAGDRLRVYARRGPYVCIYPHDRISPCKWTHEKALSK